MHIFVKTTFKGHTAIVGGSPTTNPNHQLSPAMKDVQHLIVGPCVIQIQRQLEGPLLHEVAGVGGFLLVLPCPGSDFARDGKLPSRHRGCLLRTHAYLTASKPDNSSNFNTAYKEIKPWSG
jgi:hypothetical protein